MQPGPRHTTDPKAGIKAALFDIDNTLVGNEVPDLPTERFKTAVGNAQGKIKVGIASARPLAKARHILGYIGAEGLSILCNGAQIIDNQDNSVVAEWPIAIETCKDLLAYVRDLGMTYWINDDGIDYFVRQGDGVSYEKQVDIWDHDSERVAVPDFQLSKPFVVVLHGITEEQVKDVKNFVQDHHDNDITSLIAHEIKQADGGLLFDVFVVHKHANKHDALREVARLQNISIAEIMTVGDGRNDAVLVGGAGVGIAMGNSAKETLAVATYIAPSQTDDGAAVALEFATEHLI